nr:hypothetical protein [Mesorhizobium sp. WR6]
MEDVFHDRSLTADFSEIDALGGRRAVTFIHKDGVPFIALREG